MAQTTETQRTETQNAESQTAKKTTKKKARKKAAKKRTTKPAAGTKSSASSAAAASVELPEGLDGPLLDFEEGGDGANRLSQLAVRAADYLADNEPGDVVDDLEEAARSRPVLFVAGGLLLGLAFGRFLRSSEADEQKASSRSERRRSGGVLDAAGDFFQERPLVVGAAVFGLGAIAGLSVPSSRWERDRVGPLSEQFKTRVGDLARDSARSFSEREAERADDSADDH